MKTRALQYCEVAFLAVGLGLLGIYAFFRMHGWFFQAYDSWSFEQAVKERARETEIGPTPTRKQRSEPRLEEAALPDYQGWSQARASAHAKSLSRHPRSIVGRLLIPALNMNVMVLEGTDRWTLNRAVGHIEGTALPGSAGNMGISAHRDGFFRKLGDIRKGDEIAIVTTDKTYTYAVESTQVVYPQDTHVLARSRKPTLTLVTCYPFYFVGEAPQRFIVKAQLVQ